MTTATKNGSRTATLRLVFDDEGIGAHLRGEIDGDPIVVTFETDNPGQDLLAFVGENAEQAVTQYVAEHRERIFPAVLSNTDPAQIEDCDLTLEECTRQEGIPYLFSEEGMCDSSLPDWGEYVKRDMTPGYRERQRQEREAEKAREAEERAAEVQVEEQTPEERRAESRDIALTTIASAACFYQDAIGEPLVLLMDERTGDKGSLLAYGFRDGTDLWIQPQPQGDLGVVPAIFNSDKRKGFEVLASVVDQIPQSDRRSGDRRADSRVDESC